MKISASLCLVLLLAACAAEGPVASNAPTPLVPAEPKPVVAVAAPTANATTTGTVTQPKPAVTVAGAPPVEVAGSATPVALNTSSDVQTAAVVEKPKPVVATPTPTPTPAPKPPSPAARTVEEFDTTTQEERTAAVAPPPTPAANSGDGRIGTTVASLGAADEPGFWIKTPLVKEATAGRLFYAKSGRNVQVQLIPSGSSGGSQVSLAAMRLLDAPLDGLPEIVVYSN